MFQHSFETEYQNSKPKSQFFQQKYHSEGIFQLRQRSLSPKTQSSTPSQQQSIRNCSFIINTRSPNLHRLKVKIISQNYLPRQKDSVIRSPMFSSTPLFHGQLKPSQSNDEPEFPVIDRPISQQTVKINSGFTSNGNLALILEENEDNNHQRKQSSSSMTQQKLSQLSQIELVRICEQQNSLIQQLQLDRQKQETQSLVDQIQYIIGPSHHCMYEEQLQLLNQKLTQTEEVLSRTKNELMKVISMVKKYNNDGLMTRILDLEQLVKDLDQERENMHYEIQNLGQQRDQWQMKHQEIVNKLLQLKGTEEKLEETEKKFKMQSEAFEKMNKRFKEKQIEVSDWQRKCNSHDQENNKKISRLEQLVKETNNKLENAQKELSQYSYQLKEYEHELQQQNELLDEERRKSKQLHTEMVDMRVNKIASLEEEIARQKKIISQRVDEIEDLEGKIKQLNMKIDLLETQLRGFEETANKKLQERENEWQKKNKELERQYVQVKRDINQLQISIQENEIIFQQKMQELEDACLRIDQLEASLLNHQQIEKELNLVIQQLNFTLSQRENVINVQKDQITGLEEVGIKLNQEIENLSSQLNEKSLIIKENQTQIETQKTTISQQQLSIESFKNQLDTANLQILTVKQLHEEEKQRVHEEQLKYLQQEKILKNVSNQLDQEQKEKASLTIKLSEQAKQNSELQKKIIEIQEKDEHQNITLRQQIDTLTSQIELENQNMIKLRNFSEKQSTELKASQEKYEKLSVQWKQSEEQLADSKKKEKELSDENSRLNKAIKLYKTLEAELRSYKQQIAEMEKIQIELNETKQQLTLKITEYDQCRLRLETLEIQHKKLQENSSTETTKFTQQVDYLTKQGIGYKKQLKQVQEELSDTQKKLETLMEALEGMNDDQKGKVASNITKQKNETTSINEQIKQIFIEERDFSKKEDLIEFKFTDQNVSSLVVAFWVKFNKGIGEQIFLQLTVLNEKVIELGVFLATGFVFCRYFQKKSFPLQVTSQLGIKYGKFQFVGLVLTEENGSLDMGLHVNGVRDDSVSISKSTMFPEATLTIGCLEHQSVYCIKDAILLTMKNLTLLKEIFKQFINYYNSNNEGNQFISTTEFVTQFLNKQIIKHEKQEKKQRHRSNSPKIVKVQKEEPPIFPSYIVNKPIKFHGRMMPAQLVEQCELIENEKKRCEEELKKQQQQPKQLEEVISEWSRLRMIEKMKEYFRENYQAKINLRPLVQHYLYIAQALQMISPCFGDEISVNSFQQNISKLAGNIKIIRQTQYLIDIEQFMKVMNHCGFQKISKELLLEISQAMNIMIENNGQQYIHYDHLLIILRETIVNKAENAMLKYEEKKLLLEMNKKQIDEDASPIQKFEIKQVAKQWSVNYDRIEHQNIQQEFPEREFIESIQLCYKNQQKIMKIHQKDKIIDILLNTTQNTVPDAEKIEQEILIKDQKEIKFIFTNKDLAEIVFVDLKENQYNFNVKAIPEEDQQLRVYSLIISNNMKLLDLQFIIEKQEFTFQSVQFIEQMKITELDVSLSQYYFQKTIKGEEVESEREEDIELATLLPLQEGWNEGKFTLNLNRCTNCDKHAHTTRHSEQDFIDKAQQLSSQLKEVFPNVQIIENQDKITKLEHFEVYIRGVGNRKYLDNSGRYYLFQKNEPMKQFLQSFDEKITTVYKQLAFLISVYSSSDKLGIEQERFVRQSKILSQQLKQKDRQSGKKQ